MSLRIDIYDLSDPDDRAEAERRDRAGVVAGCLHDLWQELRNRAKYDDDYYNDGATTWGEVYDRVREICNEHGVDPVGE